MGYSVQDALEEERKKRKKEEENRASSYAESQKRIEGAIAEEKQRIAANASSIWSDIETRYNSVINSYNSSIATPFWGKSETEIYNSQRPNMIETGNLIRDVEAYRKIFGDDVADSLLESLNGIKENQSSIYDSAKIFSQFENEDDYNDYYFHASPNATAERQKWYQEKTAKIAALEAEAKTTKDTSRKLEIAKELNTLNLEVNRYVRGEQDEGSKYRWTSKVVDDYYGVQSAEDFDAGSKPRNDYYIPTREDLTYYDSMKDTSQWYWGADGKRYDAFGNEIDMTNVNDRNIVIHPLENEERFTVEDRYGMWLNATEAERHEATALNEYMPGSDAWAKAILDGDYYYWDQLTEDEVNIYYYLLNNQGAGAASKYLDDMEVELSHRKTLDRQRRWTEQYEEAGFLGKLLMNVGAVPAGVFGGALAWIDDSARQLKGEEINPYNGSHTLMHLRNTVTSLTAADLDATGFEIPIVNFSLGDIYQVGMSRLDSLLATGMFGGAGTLLLGSTAASNEAYRLYQQGASAEQITLGAFSAGAAETFWEYVSFDKLVKLKDANTLRELLKTALIQGGVEAWEEGMTELTNIVTNGFIMTNESDWAKMLEENGGDTFATVQDATMRILESAFGGFLSGGVAGGVQGGRSYLANRSEQNAYAERLYGADPGALVGEALEINPDNTYAKRMQGRLDNGKDLSGRQLNKLVQQNETALRAQDVSSIESAAEARLAELGETGDVAAVAKALAKQASGEKLSRSEKQLIADSKYGQRVANELSAENIRSGEYSSAWAENIGTERINVQEYSRLVEAAQQPQEAAETAGSQVVTESAKTAQAPQTTPVVAPATTVPANDQQMTGKETVQATKEAPVAEEPKAKAVSLENVSKKYGAQAQAMVHTYQAGQDVAKYDQGYQAAYDMGKAGVAFSYLEKSPAASYLTDSQKLLAYEAGKAASDTAAKELDAKNRAATNGKPGRKKGTVRGEGVTISDLKQTFNDTQGKAYKYLSTVAEVTGIDIVLYRSEAGTDGKFQGAQGRFSRSEPGTIYIDLNAGLSDIKSVDDLAKYAMLRTFSHEFTHFIENWNPIQYNELRKVVFDTLTERGENVHDLIEDKQARNPGMSYDKASREVVAEAMTDILPDANFVQELAENHKTIFQKLVEKLKEFVANLRAYFNSIGHNRSTEANALKEQIGDTIKYLDNIVQMFDKVAVQAVENYQQTVAMEETTQEPSASTKYDAGEAALLAYKSSDSYLLNTKLREGIELSEKEQSIVNGLDDALPKLPACMGTVYRNIIFDDFGDQDARDAFVAGHSIGDIVSYPAYTSASTRIDGYTLEGNYVVHMIIDSVNGRDLEGYGNNFESEVLFSRNSNFITDKIVYDETGTPTIYLTEVANEASASDRGRSQKALSGDHRGQQEASAEANQSKVQRLPEQNRRDGEVQSVPDGDPEGNSLESGGVSGVQAEVTTEAAEENQEIPFDKSVLSMLKSAGRIGAVDLDGQKYVTNGSVMLPTTSAGFKYAHTELNAVTMSADVVRQTFANATTLVTEAPIEGKAGIDTVYIFDIGGKKLYFNKKLFHHIDGGLLYAGQYNGGGVIKSVNEDGSIKGYLLGMKFKDGAPVTDQKPSKTKSFSKKMQALVAAKTQPAAKPVESVIEHRTPEVAKDAYSQLSDKLYSFNVVKENGLAFFIYDNKNGGYYGTIKRLSGQSDAYPVANARELVYKSAVFENRQEAVDDIVLIAKISELLDEKASETTKPQKEVTVNGQNEDNRAAVQQPVSDGSGAAQVLDAVQAGDVSGDGSSRNTVADAGERGQQTARDGSKPDNGERNVRGHGERSSQSGDLRGSDRVTTEEPASQPTEEAQRLHEEVVEQIAQQSTEKPKGRNFVIGDSLDLPSGEKARYKANVEAIRLVKQLEAEGRYATEAEQVILSKYVGWGGLANAFDQKKAEWSKEFAELKELLTDEEYSSARGSTLNAHYTDISVIKAMYDGLKQLGFTGGRMMEPSSGVGNFVGAMPADMAANVRSWTMVELDGITGLIAKYLYPNADVRIQGFEKANIPNNFMDVAISNVPFGNYAIADKSYPKKVTSAIHNYFFAKSLDKVRPGGIVMFITSSYTMNSKDNTVRRYIMQKADLLGAIRLPDSAFKGNAGTEVVTDILVLKKRADNTNYAGVDFLEAPYQYVDGFYSGAYINKYFLEHPEMVLGKATMTGGMYRSDSLTYKALEGKGSLADQIREAFKNIQGKMEYPAKQTPEKTNFAVERAGKKAKNNSLVVKDGKIYQNKDGELQEVTVAKGAAERITGMLEIRDAAKELIAYQQQGLKDTEIKKARTKLNKAYDAFVKKHGFINAPANRNAIKADPDSYSILALENWNPETKKAVKSDIFSKNTIAPNRTVTSAKDVAEGLIVSVNQTGGVDAALIAKLTGKTEADVTRELLDSRTVFKTRDGGLETAEVYLSGNVRAKLRDAEAMALMDSEYQKNVEALKAVMPEDVGYQDIFVNPGTPWIPNNVYSDFAAYMLGTSNNGWKPAVDVTRNKESGNFTVELKNSYLKSNSYNTQKWGTSRRTFLDLFDSMLNSKSVVVKYKDADGKSVIDQDATAAANEKVEAIQKEFQDWLWKDEARRTELATLYNETFNSIVTPKYNGDNLTVNGANAMKPLRPHQRDAVQRIISSGGNTLLAHKVGAGKTYEMAAAAMKLKELGLVKKPLFAVPKPLVAQWGNEFMDFFPTAKLLVAEAGDFTATNRKIFANRIANGEYDAVIMSYEQFERLPISNDFARELYQEQIDTVIRAIEEAKAEKGGKSLSVKDLEKKRKSLQTKIDKLTDSAKDEDNIEFEQLGVDSIFVDEAHNFKNLFYTTSMTNVSGLSQKDGAKRSFDLYTKVRYLQKLNGGRGIVFATATPVMNSMAEMYIMQKYLQPDLLDQLGLTTFDAWAKQFGEVVNGVEIKPSGQGYRVKQSFSRFKNMSELQLLFRNFADVLTDIPGLKIPKMKGGKVNVVVCEPGQFQQDYMKELEKRADNIKNVDPTVDNMLKITSDGRKISYTQRMIDPSLPYEEGCKIYRCADNVVRVYQESSANKGTQLIFCDMATPKGKSKVADNQTEANETDMESTRLYDDIKARLMKGGIPGKEIAFIHEADTDAKKKKLFADVNDGKVRVLIGSTGKMGVGMNAQKRIAAIHHLDAPWRPGDVEQRNGRAYRQGNINEEVENFTYVTEGSFDARLWDILDRKQSFINQVMNGESVGRETEDTGEVTLSAAEVKALASGSPLIMEQVQLDTDIKKLESLRRAHRSAINNALSRLQTDQGRIATLEKLIQNGKADVASIVDTYSEGKFSITIGKKKFTEKKDAGAALMAEATAKATEDGYTTIASFAGFDLRVIKTHEGIMGLISGKQGYAFKTYPDNTTYMINHLIARVGEISETVTQWEQELAATKKDMAEQQQLIEQPFAKQAELDQKRARYNEVMEILNPKEEQQLASVDEDVQEQSRSYLDEKDSAGRELSKGQQNFFAESQARTFSGLLASLYHGTENGGFTEFDPSVSDDGISLFLTDNIYMAATYSNSTELIQLAKGKPKLLRWMEGDTTKGKGQRGVYNVYANMKNPLIVDAKGENWNKLSSSSEYQSLQFNVELDSTEDIDWDNVGIRLNIRTDGKAETVRFTSVKAMQEYLAEDYSQAMANNVALAAFNKEHGGSGIINVKWNPTTKTEGWQETTREIAKKAKAQGYDGVIIRNVFDSGKYGKRSANEKGTVYIVFGSNQIKSVDNKNPTEHPDIRYQQRTDTLTDREVLALAASQVKVSDMTDAERDALDIFQQRLSKLEDLQAERAEQGRLYKEQQFGAKVDRAKAAETLNRMHTLDGQIEKASAEVLSVEEKKVLKRVLQKARTVVEQQERQHGQEILKRWRDRRNNADAIKKYRDRIRGDVDELTNWVLHPDNKSTTKHIPDALKNTVIPFLSSINFMSKRSLTGGNHTKADKALMEQTRKLAKVMENTVDIDELYSNYTDLPPDFMKNLRSFMDTAQEIIDSNSGDFIINQMTSEELQKLSKVVRTLKKYIMTMNRFHVNSMFKHVYDAGENSIDFMDQLKPAEKTGSISNFLLWQQMRPAYAFERFGEGGQAVYDGLRRGQATLAFNTKKIMEFSEKAYTTAEVRQWENEVKTIRIGPGRVVKMRVSQIMSLYELNKREQAQGHIFGEGIRVATFKNGKQKISDVGQTLTPGELDMILRELTPRQKEVADKLQQFMQKQGGEWGNYVTVARFGEKQFGEENYFPINSDGRHLQVDADEKPGAAALYALLNMGFTKQTQEKAKNRLIVYSIFDVFSNHMASMAQYNAYALPVVDALKWFNYQRVNVDEDGTKTILGSVREQMDRAFGVPEENRPGSGKRGYAQNFVINIIKALNGTEAQGTAYDSFGLKQLHRYNLAQVAYNFRVVVQQPMAITRAAQIIDYASIMRGMKLQPAAIKRNIAEMQRYSGIAAWKSLGFYDVNISRGLTSIIKHDETALDKIAEVGMWGAEKADTMTWAAIWSACKEEVIKKQKLTPKSEGFYDAVTKLFEDVIYKTQVVDSVLTKNEFMRDKGFFARAVGSFMSEGTTTASMLVDSYDKYRMDVQRGMTRQQAWKKNSKQIVRTAYVYGIGALLLAAVQAISDAFRDDDDYEEWYEKWLEAFGGNLIDEALPFNKLPVVSDFYDLGKQLLSVFGVDTYGNPPQSVFMQWYDSLVKGTEIIYGRITGEEDRYTWYGGAYKLLQAISGMTGLPLGTATREIAAAWNSTVGAMAPSLKVKTYDSGEMNEIKYAYQDGYLTAEEATKLLLEKELVDTENEAYFTIQGWEAGKGYSRYDAIFDAVRNGGDITEAMNELTSHGYKEKDVLSQVKGQIGTWYKDGEITKQQAINMLTKYFDLDSEEITATVNKWSSKVVTGIAFEDIKDEFLEGNITEARAIDMYVRYGGYSKEKATETVTKWRAEKETGVAYDDIKDAFMDGEITAGDAKNMYITYGGLTEEKATEKVAVLTFVKKYPDLDDITYDAVENYTTYCEGAGVPANTFYDAWKYKNTLSGTVKEPMMQYINGLNLTYAQKDSLYYAMGWKESKIHEAPWH